MVRDKGDYRKPGRKDRQRNSYPRAQNGKVVSRTYRKLGTPKPNANFDAEFEKDINNAWAEVNVKASKRENSSSKELQREFTRDVVQECVAKLKNRKAAGADRI